MRVTKSAYCVLLSVILRLTRNEAIEIDVQSDYHQCDEDERSNYPHLCNLLGYALSDPIRLSNEIYHWSRDAGLIVDVPSDSHVQTTNQNYNASLSMLPNDPMTVYRRQLLRSKNSKLADKAALPTIISHGMGDSCFNSGMVRFTSHVSKLTSTYAKCIPTGSSRHTDTMNGFFLNMDASVEVFARQIESMPELKDGFNAIGLSQGNNIIRGYIAKYNDPPVNTFLSLNGLNAGTGAVPYCIPKSMSSAGKQEKSGIISSNFICNHLMDIANKKAYTTFAQTHSFQANYWRDPRIKTKETYATYSQLAQWNNEGRVYNSTLNKNYAKTKKFVWVMALQDEMVWPKEGEHWGAPNPLHPFDGEHNILDREETEWFKKDLFGLRTAEEAGKNNYETHDGPHLGFTTNELDGWIAKYFIP